MISSNYKLYKIKIKNWIKIINWIINRSGKYARPILEWEMMKILDYKLIFIVFLFVILISIQFTLNKIYVELKDIKRMMKNKELEEISEREKNFNSYRY